MVIKETKALSLTEAAEYVEDTDVKGFLKKFTKLKANEAKKLREELAKLDNYKVREEHIAKIIDLLPEDAQDLAKVFNDVSLEDNETAQILEIIKKYQ